MQSRLAVSLTAAACLAIPAGASALSDKTPQRAVAVKSTRATNWHASGLGAGPPQQEIEVGGFARLSRRISLAQTRIVVRTLFAEHSVRGELIRRPDGRDASPLALSRHSLAEDGDRAVYGAGAQPHVLIVLNRTPGRERGDPRREISVDLQVAGGRFREPRRCVRETFTTLRTHFTIFRGPDIVADVILTTRWSCRMLS